MKAKRILCMLLVLFVCVATMATKADAANVYGDWEYNYYEGDIMITGYNGNNTNVTVPNTIEGLPVIRIDNYAFDAQSAIISVTLPDSVKTIGNCAFRGCTNLRSISLSKKLQVIGEYAFEECLKLTSITLPEQLDTIGYRAFLNCKGIEKITVESENLKDFGSANTFCNVGKDTESGVTVKFTDTVTRIPKQMFDCDPDIFAHIKNVTIGKNVSSIGKWAFADCLRLEKVSFADGCVLRSIIEGAFLNCPKLTTISFPAKLESIERDAFADCISLSSVNFPKSLVTIGYHAFYNCKKLEKITVKAENLVDLGNENTFYNAGKDAENGLTVVFTDTVKRIPKQLFDCEPDNFARIKSVSIGKNVSSVGQWAFADCQKLEKVTFADESKLETIDYGAFSNCTKLSSIKFPAKLEVIGQEAFERCSSLPSITLPKALLNVGYHAFYNCRAVEKIIVQSTNLQNLNSSRNTFYNVGKDIEGGITVTFTDTVKRIPNYMFDGDYNYCPNIRKVSIGKNVTEIGGCAFGSCQTMKSVSFAAGSKVSKIGEYAFADCDSLLSVVLPDTVTEIANYAFGYCDALSTIRFSGNYPWIGGYAFDDVTANAYYPKSNATWTSDKLANYGGTITWKSYTPATISTQPKTGYAKNGEVVETTVKAKGDGLKYQWYIRNADQTKYSKSSVTSATYSCKMTETTKDRRAYCVITDKYGNSVQTKTVVLRMKASVKTQPKNTYTKSGGTAKVTVKALGDDLTYQWYIKNAGGSKYSKSSVTSATYSCKMNDKSKDRLVYCVVSDKYGNTVKTKTVILRMAATITTQPKAVTAANGTTAKTTVKAVGDGLTYQWYIKNPGKDTFGKSSVTSATYSCKMSKTTDGRQVYCVVTDAYGKTAKSNTVTLSMK